MTTKVPLEIALTTLGRPDDLGAQHMTTLGPGVLKSSVPTFEFQSLGGACCFDRPPQGGAWYTCPVLIVRSSLDVYKPWWDRAGEIVV